MNKILLVDDDIELTTQLRETLEQEGFHVIVANDGQHALDMFDKTVDLVLLDIVMPGMNGFNVLSQLRQHYTVPVFFITAKDNEVDKILSLELGADDYIVKPFNNRELIARIRAILRRCTWDKKGLTRLDEQSQNHDVYKVDKLVVNIKQQIAMFDNQYLDLTGTEFHILQKLIESKGEIITRNMLSETVLGKSFIPLDRAVDVHVSNLRKKLPPRSDGLPWIKTLRSKGYLFIFDKAPLNEE